ncbi:MAG: GNAT family N-acetyltransferase [Opitutaceae bacterium]|nr:GNAT family N-acetyltransferase [Opitutaceae bacterium]
MEPAHQPELRRFVMAYPEGDAYLAYSDEPTAVVFTHTFVPQPLRGRGIAEKLMRSGIEWAESTGKALDATCSYAQAYLERQRSRAG